MYRRAVTKVSGLLARLGSMGVDRNEVIGAERPERRSYTSHASSAVDGPRSLIDALPDAALLLDNHGTLIAVNAAAIDVFGHLNIGEHIGRSARQPELANAVKAVMSTGGKVIFDMVLTSPTHRHLDGAVSGLSGFGMGKGAPTLLVILQDISEREALARMRMEFVANASHELRTPLAALSGFIETLRGPAKDDPAARERFLVIMYEQAQRMTRLIDDLLVLSRVEMRAHLAPVTVADLNHVASEAVRLAAPLAWVTAPASLKAPPPLRS